jgi:zinc and cadmium transporter
LTTLGWIVLFTVLGGLVSVLIAGIFLLLSERLRARALPHLVSFATGALLGAALLALLPEAVRSAGPDGVQGIGLALVAGIGLFFVLEKAVLWRHSHSGEYADHGAHHDHHQHRDEASAVLVLIGDSIHNALDGMLIAAAFMTDVKLGIVTGIAAMAHEIPQEVGDFAVLLNGGMSRARALFWNLITSLTSVAGGVLAYLGLQQVSHVLPLCGRGRSESQPAPAGRCAHQHHPGGADCRRRRHDRLGGNGSPLTLERGRHAPISGGRADTSRASLCEWTS